MQNNDRSQSHNKPPLISIIMPAYNCQKYVQDAIESILNQTFKDFEFIIIDDGSTDASLRIIKSYPDRRITVIQNNRNMGLIWTLNRGLSLANGKYIARMDADDLSNKYRLEMQMEFMERYPEITVLGTWFELSTGILIKHPTTPRKIKNGLFFDYCMIGHPTAMIRGNVIREKKIAYDRRFVHAEDYALWARMSNEFKFANIPKNLLMYRVHDEQVSEQYHDVQTKNSQRIRFRMLLRAFPALPRGFIKPIYRVFFRKKNKMIRSFLIAMAGSFFLVFINFLTMKFSAWRFTKLMVRINLPHSVFFQNKSTIA